MEKKYAVYGKIVGQYATGRDRESSFAFWGDLGEAWLFDSMEQVLKFVSKNSGINPIDIHAVEEVTREVKEVRKVATIQ